MSKQIKCDRDGDAYVIEIDGVERGRYRSADEMHLHLAWLIEWGDMMRTELAAACRDRDTVEDAGDEIDTKLACTEADRDHCWQLYCRADDDRDRVEREIVYLRNQIKRIWHRARRQGVDSYFTADLAKLLTEPPAQPEPESSDE